MKKRIIFLLFFILLTFMPIPVFTIFREQIGYKNTENKAISDFPELNRQNFSTWPKRFEEWLSDTLPFKTQFIELFRGFQLKTGMDFTQSDVIRGKENLLFYRKTIENYKGISRFTDEELETITNNLNGFFEQMENRGTKCLFYIAPDKEQVYNSFMPENIRRISTESRADQLTDYLREHLPYPVIYPKEQFQQTLDTYPLYFDTDTHWNDLGGWFAARQVKSAFTGADESSIEPQYHHHDSNGLDLAGMLGISDQFSESNAVEMEFDDGLGIYKTQTINHGNLQRFTNDDPHSEQHEKLLIIGDSFSEYFIRSAIHDIKDILFITYGDLYLIDLEEESPDYLVIMLVERNLPFLYNGIY